MRKRQLLELQEHYEAFVHAGGKPEDMDNYCNTEFDLEYETGKTHKAREVCSDHDNLVKCWHLGPAALWEKECDEYNDIARGVSLTNIGVIIFVTITNLSVEIFSSVCGSSSRAGPVPGPAPTQRRPPADLTP